MPLRSVETAPGYRVFERTCDGCGSSRAPYGTGSIREALRTRDATKVQCWCGPNGCIAQSHAA